MSHLFTSYTNYTSVGHRLTSATRKIIKKNGYKYLLFNDDLTEIEFSAFEKVNMNVINLRGKENILWYLQVNQNKVFEKNGYISKEELFKYDTAIIKLRNIIFNNPTENNTKGKRIEGKIMKDGSIYDLRIVDSNK